MKTTSLFFALIACLGFIAFGAQAQGLPQTQINDRLDRLEREVQTLQMDRFKKGDAPTPPSSTSSRKPPRSSGTGSSADLSGGALDRLDALETEVRDLTGRLEKFEFDLRAANTRMDKLVMDTDKRLMHIEDSAGRAGSAAPMNSEPAAVATPPVPAAATSTPAPDAMIQVPATGAALPDGTPSQQYEYAITLVKKNSFADAEKALIEFLKLYPSHALTANAQYWLAETYYAQKDFSKSAVNFLKVYQDFPKSGKAPDSLLKLALSLAQLNSHTEACATLEKLAKEFTDAPVSIKRRGAGEWDRLKCVGSSPAAAMPAPSAKTPATPSPSSGEKSPPPTPVETAPTETTPATH